MKYILGKKISMTQVFKDNGDVVPVTIIQAGPCFVTQIRSIQKDGYNAVQLSYGTKKNLTKSLIGHFNGLGSFSYVREVRDKVDVSVGDLITVETFNTGDKIKVTGTSKGKGFQGVVKRHGFAGAKSDHGNKDQSRMPGSIGSTGPGHVFKGMRMGGRMGNDKVTISNLEIIKVDIENNLLYVKGAVPGARNSFVMVHGKGDLKVVLKIKNEDIKSEIIENQVVNNTTTV